MAILKITTEQVAQICHDANRALCIALGDTSQVTWENAPEWQQYSAITGVTVIAENPVITPAELHEAWSRHKLADGWVVGPVKDAVKKEHPCLVPYTDLPAEQQWKDALFGAIVRTFLN